MAVVEAEVKPQKMSKSLMAVDTLRAPRARGLLLSALSFLVKATLCLFKLPYEEPRQPIIFS